MPIGIIVCLRSVAIHAREPVRLFGRDVVGPLLLRGSEFGIRARRWRRRLCLRSFLFGCRLELFELCFRVADLRFDHHHGIRFSAGGVRKRRSK